MVLEDPKSKISEKFDQNWSCQASAARCLPWALPNLAHWPNLCIYKYLQCNYHFSWNTPLKSYIRWVGHSKYLRKQTTAKIRINRTVACLWSKRPIFRWVWRNVNLQPCPWASQVLIPHSWAFKRGNLICSFSRGSKVTSRKSLKV